MLIILPWIAYLNVLDMLTMLTLTFKSMMPTYITYIASTLHTAYVQATYPWHVHLTFVETYVETYVSLVRTCTCVSVSDRVVCVSPQS